MTQHTEPGTEPVFCSCERWDFWCIVNNLFIQQMPIPAVCLLPPVPIVSVCMASILRGVWTGNVPASAMMSTLNLSVLSYPQGPLWISEDIQLSWTAPPLGRHLPCDIPGPHFVFLPHMETAISLQSFSIFHVCPPYSSPPFLKDSLPFPPVHL